MGCITAAERTRLTAKLTKLYSIIETLEDAMIKFDDVKGYTFDSGEGRQSTTYRDTGSIERTISRLEARADRIRRILDGTTNPAMTLRRKLGSYHGGRRGYC